MSMLLLRLDSGSYVLRQVLNNAIFYQLILLYILIYFRMLLLEFRYFYVFLLLTVFYFLEFNS